MSRVRRMIEVRFQSFFPFSLSFLLFYLLFSMPGQLLNAAPAGGIQFPTRRVKRTARQKRDTRNNSFEHLFKLALDFLSFIFFNENSQSETQ